MYDHEPTVETLIFTIHMIYSSSWRKGGGGGVEGFDPFFNFIIRHFDSWILLK